MSYSMISAEQMTKIFQPGEVVFEDGSKGSHMYLVIAGTVNIVKSTEQGQTLLTTLSTGDMFGEMAVVDSGIRTATAVAAEHGAQLMAIDQGRFVYLVSQQPAFALSVMRVLSRRIGALSAQLKSQTQETHEHR